MNVSQLEIILILADKMSFVLFQVWILNGIVHQPDADRSIRRLAKEIYILNGQLLPE